MNVQTQRREKLNHRDDLMIQRNLAAFGADKDESCASDVDRDVKEYHVLYDKWLKLKNENLRLHHNLVQTREQDVAHEHNKLVEELGAVKKRNKSIS